MHFDQTSLHQMVQLFDIRPCDEGRADTPPPRVN